MTQQSKVTASHKNVWQALAAAQLEMGGAKKTADNQHFRSKYADLASVVEAVRPSLNRHGIALYHVPQSNEFGHSMKTVLFHGESETQIECTVPLIIGKNDMQGYKSATTYAKRIGVESVTSTAPEDDDGNAAAASVANEGKGDVKPREKSWAQTIIDTLPETATEHDKAEAITVALCAQWKRKKTEGELNNEWDRRSPLVKNIQERFPDMHERIVDAFELRMNDIKDKETA